MCEWHKHPINVVLHIIALIIGIWGLWQHDWNLIGGAVLIAALGHIIQAIAMRKNKKVTVKKRRR